MVFAVQRCQADFHFVRGFDPIARLQLGEQISRSRFGLADRIGGDSFHGRCLVLVTRV